MSDMETATTETDETTPMEMAKPKTKKKVVDAPRGEFFKLLPDEIVIIGKDTEDGPTHPLYDERIKLPLDEGMVKNIRVYGVIEPVLVQKDGDRVLVIDGRRRVLHAREANRRAAEAGEELLRVPVIFRRGDEKTIFGISRSANAIRLDDGPLTNARNMQRMIDMGMSEDEIAVAYGCKRQMVKDTLSLLDLREEVRKAVGKGELSVTAGATLAKLDKDEQLSHLEQLRAEGAKPTVDRVINKIKQARGKGEHLSSHERLKREASVYAVVDMDNDTKEDLKDALDKACKANTGKTVKKYQEHLVALEAKKAAKGKRGKKG